MATQRCANSKRAQKAAISVASVGDKLGETPVTAKARDPKTWLATKANTEESTPPDKATIAEVWSENQASNVSKLIRVCGKPLSALFLGFVVVIEVVAVIILVFVFVLVVLIFVEFFEVVV